MLSKKQYHKNNKNEALYLYRNGDNSSCNLSELHQRKNNCK